MAGWALAAWLSAAVAASAAYFLPHHQKPELAEILSRMNASARRLKTVSASIEYTNVTVIVNDSETKSGNFYLHKGRHAKILIHFLKPAPEQILVTSKKAEIYNPRIDQVQQYDLSRHADLLQQFLLLGFGTDEIEIKSNYSVRLTGEEEIGGGSTAVLELKPLRPDVASQLSKIELWVNEESWLPVQQKFYEASGNYLVVRYSDVQVNRWLSPSIFHLTKSAKRVKMK